LSIGFGESRFLSILVYKWVGGWGIDKPRTIFSLALLSFHIFVG